MEEEQTLREQQDAWQKELDAVLQRRHPLYRQIAHRTVDATLSPTDQLHAALRSKP